MRDFHDYNLLAHNTFGIEALCRRFVEFDTVDELQQLVRSLQKEDFPLLLLGGGSNLLLTADYPATVLHSAIKGMTHQEEDDCVLLRVGSGEVWDEVVAACVAQGWYGAENLSLIPGEVGASAVQNIGAYGTEVKDLIVVVEAVEIAWKNRFVITYVTYRLSKKFEPRLDYGNIRMELEKKGIGHPTAQELRDTIIEIREAKLPDPKIEGNGGSFFMNPIVTRQQFELLLKRYPQMPHYFIDEKHEKIPAGWMIDQCGWKGRSLGRAGVHDKQALVLVNRGGATGQEIVDLCHVIQQDVKTTFGIDIEPEVNILP